MNRADFLKLITETYFNTFDECIEDVDFLDFSFEYRKNQFLKQIERKQKAVEKDFEISLKDFIEESNFAINFLDGQIASNIHEEIKNKSKSELNGIKNNDAVIYVPLEKVNSSLTGILCQKDVDYIKICFDSFVSLSKQPKPQQPEVDNLDKTKKQPQYTHIFKDNSFEVWQRMFDEFKITKSSRTDIDFMFQIMKYDELIYNNIGLTDIQNWINEVYDIAFEKIKYTDPKQKSNQKRMSTYNLIIQNKAKV